jgi:predicted SAM-dependent methyltransferase
MQRLREWILEMKLHLGCGNLVVEGWMNVSAHPVPGAVVMKAENMELAKDSLDFVYASHFLEHLTVIEAVKLLSKLHIALKPTGIIRFTVPGLDFFVNEYINRTMSCKVIIDSFEKRFHRKPLIAEYFMHAVTSSNVGCFGHKYMYDSESLMELFKNFKCSLKRFHESMIPDIELLEPIKNSEHTIFIEGTK